MKRSTLFLAASVAGLMAGGAAQAADCPEGGLRFGVEPYESAQRLLPVYTDLAKMIGDKLPPEQIVEKLYIRCLSRKPTPEETEGLKPLFAEGSDVKRSLDDIFWALLNSREFLFNH